MTFLLGVIYCAVPSMHSPSTRRSAGTPALATPVVGVRIPPWATFTRHIFEGIIDHVRIYREQWNILSSAESTNEIEPVKIDKNWTGDGLIVFRPAREEVEAWKSKRIPVVNLSSESLDLGVPSVLPDNELVGKLAAAHLIELGLTRFAFWGDSTRRYSRERESAFGSELRQHGFDYKKLGFEVSSLPLARKWKKIRTVMQADLASLKKPIGIFARDDIAATGLVRTCREAGFRVPDDVAVIGCNNDATFCHTTTPPLTSVVYPGREIGQTAARLLSQQMTGDTKVSLITKVAPLKVIPRESTDVLAFDDPVVARSLRLIRREAPLAPVKVNDIIDQLPVSRAVFQTSFREAVGRTPKEEITRVRVERLKELLATTTWSIKEIAFQMKFGSSEELSRFIRRELKISATGYRESARSNGNHQGILA